MSSAIDICNLALAHLGDTATVASIDPPEGSAQSEHCARFYPVARDTVLEKHPWNFITRRTALALLTATNDQWAYVYAKPNMMKTAIAVLSPDADDDFCIPSATIYDQNALVTSSSYAPQPYCIETLSTGEEVILTNQEDAVLRYTVSITDPTKFPALVALSISWLLASMLAGPIIKGDQGASEAKRCLSVFVTFLSQAVEHDSSQRNIRLTHSAPWIAGR